MGIRTSAFAESLKTAAAIAAYSAPAPLISAAAWGANPNGSQDPPHFHRPKNRPPHSSPVGVTSFLMEKGANFSPSACRVRTARSPNFRKGRSKWIVTERVLSKWKLCRSSMAKTPGCVPFPPTSTQPRRRHTCWEKGVIHPGPSQCQLVRQRETACIEGLMFSIDLKALSLEQPLIFCFFSRLLIFFGSSSSCVCFFLLFVAVLEIILCI